MYRAANSRPPATAAYQDKQEIRTCKRPCSGKLPPASRGREAAYAAPSETSAARCFFRTACAILMKRDTGCSKQPPQYKKAPTLPDRHTGPVWQSLARSGSTPSSAQYSANPTSGKRSRAVQPPQRARRPIPLSVRRNGCRPSLRQRVLLCTFDNVSYAFTLLSVFFQSSSFLLYLFIDKSQSFYGCI